MTEDLYRRDSKKPRLVELKGPNLFKWQSDVMFKVFNNWTNTIHVIKSKRQVGKSILLENILLKTAIERKGSDSFVVSPTNAQADKIFNELVKAIKNTPVYKNHSVANHNITFSGGSHIYFKSAEQRENLRGYTVTGILCIDEAAYISDAVISDVMPWVDANKAPIVFTSTPVGRQGLFYKFYIEGLQDNEDQYFSYDWAKYDTSLLLTEERKQFYQRTLPRDKYITDILGEFLDSKSPVFGDYSSVLTNDIDPDDTVYYFGIDWATGVGGDETAIAIFNSKLQLVAIIHFKDKDETETINLITELAKKYRPKKITVELNSIGRVFFGLLDKALKNARISTQLKGFTTTNESKETIVNKLQVAIQNKEVTLLRDPDLDIELSMFEMKLTPTNKRQYMAKAGFHDDMIMAICIGFDSINSGKYNII